MNIGKATISVNSGLRARSCMLAWLLFGWLMLHASNAGADIYSDLADSTNSANGDALVAVKQPFTGAVGRTVHAKLAESLSVEDFGAVGNGTTNDSAAIQNALNAAAPNGIVRLSKSGRYVIDSSITIPSGVTLSGAGGKAGSQDFSTTWINSCGSALLLNSAATINMNSCSAIVDLFILRKGLSVPAQNNSAFAGTAISIGNGTDNYTDCLLRGLVILGFNRAVMGNRVPRIICDDVKIDCNNGIEITNAGDPIKLLNCHCWPFATVAYVPYVPSQITRPGTAYKFNVNVDGGKVTNCFAFDYQDSFGVVDCAGLVFDHCGADSPEVSTAVGWRITGSTTHIQLTGCQAVGQQYGMIVNASSEAHLSVVNGGFFAANSVNHFRVEKGGLLLNNVDMGSTTDGVVLPVGAGNSKVMVSGCTSDAGISGYVVKNDAGSNAVLIGNDNFFYSNGRVYSGGTLVPSVASGAGVQLPSSGDVIQVTGTTNIFGFTGGWPGRQVTLLFTGALTLTDSAGLQLAGNFTTANNATLTLAFTSGTQCYEIERKLN